MQPPSVIPGYCTQAPYAAFLPLRDFAPAVQFCTVFQAQNTVPSTSNCPKGNALCAVLAQLAKCDRTLISKACTCIGVPMVNPCIDGARAVSPPPAGLICQQRGTLTTVGSDDREFPAPHPENSINGCGAYCLDHWDCEVSEYNSADGLCTYYFNSAADEGFVADPASAFIYSDMNCFESC